MKPLFVLATVMFVLFLALPNAAEAQKHPRPVKPKPFKGEIYSTLDGRVVLTMTSATELEITQGGVNLICKYTIQDNTVRVVVTSMGGSQAVYYRVIAEGLQDSNGRVYYNPARLKAERQQVQLLKKRQEEAQRHAEERRARSFSVIQATLFDRLDYVTELVNAGVDVNYRHGSGETLLTYAASEGRVNIASFLLEKGFALEATDGNGKTPLTAAIFAGKVATVRLFLQKGSNPNRVDKDGNTPLHDAVRLVEERGSRPKRSPQYDEIVELLCEQKIDVNAKNKFGFTALYYAQDFHFSNSVNILLKFGADPKLGR